ncbi:PaaI family thioesterase [Solidesulfovibrio sp.]
MDMQWFLDRDAFAKSLGIRLIEARPGYAKAAMDITQNHRNGAGIAHGGAIFSLADLAFAVAANSHGKLSLAVAASIAFVKAGLGATLFAEAREISLGAKMATYAVTIANDAGDVIASFQGTVYRKDVPYTRESA